MDSKKKHNYFLSFVYYRKAGPDIMVNPPVFENGIFGFDFEINAWEQIVEVQSELRSLVKNRSGDETPYLALMSYQKIKQKENENEFKEDNQKESNEEKSG